MPIKFVVNGYFRSGTTFLWNWFSSLDCVDLAVYEPFHPQIAQNYLTEKANKEINKLHNLRLWEWVDLIEGDVLKNSNKGISNINRVDLENYLNIFERSNKNILLQTNRLHFHFRDINEINKEIKILHVIRNPISVYNSILSAFYIEDVLMKRIMKKVFFPFSHNHCFEIWDFFNFIQNCIGHPIIEKKWLQNLNFRLSYFAKFVLVWTISNYVAISSLEDDNKILVFEEMYNKPIVVVKQLSSFFGEEMELPVLKQKDLMDTKFEKFYYYVHLFKIEKEFDFVMGYLNRK